MAELKQRKVVLSFYVFGSSFPSKVIPFPPSSYTICKAQRRKEEMSLGAAGNDEFIMIAEGVRVSFTSPKWLCGAASWQCREWGFGGRSIDDADRKYHALSEWEETSWLVLSNPPGNAVTPVVFGIQ